MNDDYEDPGLAMFDERATVVGGFPNAVLGYDKKEVDDHVRKLERQVLDLRRRVQEQTSEHELLRSQASATDFTRLTGHAAVLLNAAESQSDELRTRAEIEAENIRQAARRDAEELRAAGQQEADDMRSTAMANLRRLRDKQTDELNATLAATRAEADQVVASATRHGEAITHEAEQQAAAILAAAQVEAARITSEAQTAADRTRSTAAQAASEAHSQAAAMLADATAQHQAATKVLADETEAAVQIRATAGQEAESVRIQAVREAEQHLAATRSAGAALRARLDAEAERRKEQLVAEIAALTRQKNAVQNQLGEIAGIGQRAAGREDLAGGAWPQALYPDPDTLTPASRDAGSGGPDEDAAGEQAGSVTTRAARHTGRTPSNAVEPNPAAQGRDDASGPGNDADRPAVSEREGR